MSIEGKLDEIATRIYKEEVLTLVDVLKKEKYNALDNEQLELDKIQGNMEYNSDEYISARANSDSKRAKIKEDYDKKESNLMESFNSQILLSLHSMWKERDRVVQEHFGENGVINASLKKMTPEERAYDTSLIKDQNGNEISNCPEDVH